MDRVIETVKKEITRLESVGVKTYWTSHVKEKDQSDLFTGANYTSLTANMPMKYFNSIKNSSHVVAFGYFDRSIEKQEVGDENKVTKKKKTRNAVLDETRKIKFRDDAMVADAKSRFAHITDEINLDCDEFIQAIKDAIEAERKGSAPAKSTTKKKAPRVEEPEEVMAEFDEALEKVAEIAEEVPAADIEIDDIFADEEIDLEALCADIRVAFKSADAETKSEIKAILKANNMTKLDVSLGEEKLKSIADMLGI